MSVVKVDGKIYHYFVGASHIRIEDLGKFNREDLGCFECDGKVHVRSSDIIHQIRLLTSNTA